MLSIVQSIHDMQKIAYNFACDISAMNSVLINLYGPVGAGKTTFVSYCINAIDSTIQVSSPTYSIVHSYSDRITHIDAYRIEDYREMQYIDIPSSGIVFMEWPKFTTPDNLYDYDNIFDIKINIEKINTKQNDIDTYIRNIEIAKVI